MRGRTPALDTLDQALEVQARHLVLWERNEEMIRKSAPGGLWDSPEAHAYCLYLRPRLAALVADHAALCGTLNTWASVKHRAAQEEDSR